MNGDQYWEDARPRGSIAPPRADVTSLAACRLLDGRWRFRLAMGAHDLTVGFEAVDFADAAWDELHVTSHWQLRGYGQPIGLHRMQHRTVAVEIESGALVVRCRTGAAATDLAIDALYRWTCDGDGVLVQLETEPVGTWTRPLPRLGLRLALPDSLSLVEWFGRGPGEYRDSRAAARVGRFAADVDAMQTTYAFPQENGARIDVRWATLTDVSRAGVRIEGAPTFQLTARRWASEDLDAATHAHELRPTGQIVVNADLAQHGLGSASCGPGVRDEHALLAAPARFALRFSEAT